MRSRCLCVWLDLRDHVYIHMSMPGFGANELRDSLAEMSMVELRFSRPRNFDVLDGVKSALL
jgi:hypothetical protein